MTPSPPPTTSDTRRAPDVANRSDAVSARRVALPAGPDIDPWSLAGDDGIVLADGGRVLIGLGTAHRIDLPGRAGRPGGGW